MSLIILALIAGMIILGMVFTPKGSCDGCSHGHDHGHHHNDKKSGLIIVNVLDKQAYDDCHIADSINVALDELDDFAQTVDKKDAELVFYCSNYRCTASGFAAKKLKKDGFEHVWAYEGGAAEWYQKGLPVEGPCAAKYLRKEVQIADDMHNEDIPVITALELKSKIDKEAKRAA